MLLTEIYLSAFRRCLAITLLALSAAIAGTARVEAQLVAVIVNGDPITNYDVEQRTKLMQISSHKTPPRQEVIEELISERLKIQQLRKYAIDGMDKDVDNAFANMARRMRLSAQQFIDALAKGGVKPDTLKSRIKAELIWSQIIRAKYQSSFQISDKDVLAKLEDKASDATPSAGYDFTLQPILFIVPRGSSPAAVEARKREAEGLRGRFQDCEEGLRLARGLHDVAVRAPLLKSSAEFPPELRDILDKTEVGRLTAPEVTQNGIEFYAVCAKKPSAAENAPGRRKVREELFQEKFQFHSKQYLKELRSQAMIEYR